MLQVCQIRTNVICRKGWSWAYTELFILAIYGLSVGLEIENSVEYLRFKAHIGQCLVGAFSVAAAIECEDNV